MTGATGFIGQKVARQLASRGLPLQLMVRRQRGAQFVTGLDCVQVPARLEDVASLEHALAGCDTVIHLAARA